jgi:tetratricopeptide (TPR) repeat protein
MRRTLALMFLAALTGLVAAPFVAHAHAEAGTPVPDVEMAGVSGERLRPVDPRVRVNVLVFIRSGQDRSLEALKAMARCERDLAGRSVRFLGILPAGTTVEEARALGVASGVKMPLVFDAGDALYQTLLVRLHPAVFLVDAKARVTDFEQYRQIDYCDVIAARIRFRLGEIDQAALELVLEPVRNTMPGENPRDIATREVNLGRRQLQIRQYDKAIASANKALGLAPVAGALVLLGDVAAARGDCASAVKQYQAALRLEPGEALAAQGLKGCLGK